MKPPLHIILIFICLLAAFAFSAGMITQGLFVERMVDRRLKDYEDYLVSEQRMTYERFNAVSGMIAILEDDVKTLYDECAANRACWIRMAGKK